jgi:hypothetical protein
VVKLDGFERGKQGWNFKLVKPVKFDGFLFTLMSILPVLRKEVDGYTKSLTIFENSARFKEGS